MPTTLSAGGATRVGQDSLRARGGGTFAGGARGGRAINPRGFVKNVREPPRIEYDLGSTGRELQQRLWELRGLSWAGAVRLASVRAARGLLECGRLQVDRQHLALGGRDYPYYAPLEMFRPGRRTAPLYRRLAALLWVALSERVVELPVAWAYLRERPSTAVLEVGNVLGYWYDAPARVIVDRYERLPGVVNEDITTYHPAAPFDLIMSISTLEHVGFDESPRDPGKFLRALQHLESLRKPHGRMFISVPTGYNPSVEEAIRSGAFGAYELRAVVGDPGRRRGFHEVRVEEALSKPLGIVFATRG